MKSKIRKTAITIIAFIICFTCFYTLLAEKTLALAETVPESETSQLKYSDGSHYEGDIEAGQIRNGTGTYSWSTGETYEGTWVNDVQSGIGKMIWPELGVYEGEFQNGKRQGHGVFTWLYDDEPEDGKPISFDGEWENDHIGSSGTMTFANLGIYEGSFSGNVRSGVGKFTWNNGDQYYGQWVKDQIEGDGILTLMDGTSFEGQFKNNILIKGTVTYAIDGGIATREVKKSKTQAAVTILYEDGTKVVGTLKGTEFTGNVTITYATGDTYVGTMKNGLKSGKGTYKWAGGAHYTGSWENDKMSGNGKYFYGKDENINYLSGTFEDGVPSGKLIYVSEKKWQFETVWKNGECTSITYKK